MNKRKHYNPNSFNALDAALAFISLLIVFEIFRNIFISIVRPLINSPDFDYYLFDCIDSILSQSVIFIVAFIWCGIRRVSFFSGGGFVYKFDMVQILFSVLLVFGIYFLVYQTHLKFNDDLLRIFYQKDLNTYYEELESKIKGNVGFALLSVYVLTPLLPCFIEEIFYRGIIMRGLRQFGVTFSIVLSSICFSLMHGNFEQIVLQFVGGLAIASAVSLTGNMLVGVAMHFANNFFPVFFNVFINGFDLSRYLGAEFAEAMMILFGVICFVVSAAYFINMLVVKTRRHALNEPETLSVKDSACYAEIKRKDEAVWQTIYPVQINESLIYDGNYVYKYKNKESKINSRSNNVLSIAFLAVGIILSVVLIFVHI